jgi:hypothetical protein
MFIETTHSVHRTMQYTRICTDRQVSVEHILVGERTLAWANYAMIVLTT